MSDINIKETIEDKKSWFNIKRFKIGQIDFEKPEKSIDSKFLKKDDEIKDLKFIETSKEINRFEAIEAIHSTQDNKKEVDNFFNKKEWNNKPHIINLTFGFNPENFIKNQDKRNVLVGLLDYYQEYSNFINSVPNLKISKFNPETKKNETKINVEGYIKFVDFAYKTLQTKNSKPIFAPISLKFSQKDLLTLIKHYIKKEIFYYWVDFEGRSINLYSLGKLRFLSNMIKREGFYDKSIMYFSNINREIISNPMDTKSPASDVLSPLAGANIIGVNRKPRRVIPKSKNTDYEKIKLSKENKIRILDIKSYYYVKQNIESIQEKDCVIKNAINLEQEFEEQAQNLLNNKDINSFLQQKTMLNSYKNGQILKGIESKEDKKSKWY